MGLLERCHSYKDKLGRGIAPSHGLFAYPVLMAADILIYDSDVVPVGRDQKAAHRDDARSRHQVQRYLRTNLEAARAEYPRRNRRGARPGRRKDEQELRQRHRHLRGSSVNAEENHEPENGLNAGRSSQSRSSTRRSSHSTNWSPVPTTMRRWSAIFGQAASATGISRRDCSPPSGNTLNPCGAGDRRSSPIPVTWKWFCVKVAPGPIKSPKR